MQTPQVTPNQLPDDDNRRLQREYIRKLIKGGQLVDPCLELGATPPDFSHRTDIVGAGMTYVGSDMVKGPGVDVTADFCDPPVELRSRFQRYAPFGSVVIANVLEHTFDPIRVLDNAFGLLRPGGFCITITPVVWPLHSCPYDFWRINPDFYRRYAIERHLKFLDQYFEFIGFGPIPEGNDAALPVPTTNRFQYWKSRIVHRAFNTVGRGMVFRSYVAIGAVFQKP